MYKLSTTQLEALKEALVESNRLLGIIQLIQPTEEFYKAIEANEAQIKILTEQFYVA